LNRRATIKINKMTTRTAVLIRSVDVRLIILKRDTDI